MCTNNRGWGLSVIGVYTNNETSLSLQRRIGYLLKPCRQTCVLALPIYFLIIKPLQPSVVEHCRPTDENNY